MSITTDPPTLDGFTTWVRDVMGADTTVLPDDSIYLQYAYYVAIEIVNLQLQKASALIYRLAVYNLGGSNLINWAQDPLGSPIVPGSEPPLQYWAFLRKQYGTANFVAGTISAAYDQGTGESIATVEGLTNLTIGQLQLLRDPFGRTYLGYAQAAGSLWGLS